MRDVDLFTRLLTLERPWAVARVDLDEAGQQIEVWLRHRRNARFRCPQCAVILPIYDHVRRRWRHLDHGSWMTWLRARVPRVRCLVHGLRQVRLPWALPGGRFTIAFERHAIATLLEADVLGASRLLRLSWHQSWNVMERAVTRGLKAKRRRIIPYLGIDEKAIAKRHRYVTLVSDLTRGTVEFIAFDRKQSSLDTYFQALRPKQLAGIQALAMDMWEPFIRSTHQHVPDAANKIVFDRYHIMKHMLEAVDAVRKAEHRRLQEAGDDTLKRTKYLWLFTEDNLPDHYAAWFARLKRTNLTTARAWAIKECLRVLWTYQYRGWGERHWQAWYFWATHSALPPVVKAAQMIHRHLANVLTYFQHRITNAASEGLNSTIQTIKKTRLAIAIAST
jgi:transposase